MIGFWAAIDLALDRIETERPATFNEIKLFLENVEMSDNPDATFFAGSGGDRSLAESLDAAGWRCIWADSSYYYVAKHVASGEVLTYIEGDVERGDTTVK